MENLSSNSIALEVNGQEVARNLLRKRWFLVSLLVATWLPIAFFIFVIPSRGTVTSLAGIKTVFLFLGTAHVPATLFFYFDKKFSGIIRKHPVRYIYVPIFLIVVTGLVFAFTNPITQAFALLFYWAWQAFHYGRQNVGIYAFASIAETGTAPRKEEKLAIEFGTILAILGTFKLLGTAVAPAYLHRAFDLFYQLGLIAFFAVPVFSLVVYIKYFKHTTFLKSCLFFTSVFFFAPVFISTDNNIGFLSYAIAHGLQYIIFMTVISANTNGDSTYSYKSLIQLSVLLLLVGFAFWRVADLRDFELVKSTWAYARVADFLFGAVLGATMSHFVVDAGAWRLSMQNQREYIKKRFSFVFD
ncbi:MAG TPA: hypothetical protein VFI24_05330 [Pyrinomonadaceae bacterium]|nr:hypothetical protein [Pyrinomonadaceae bacterium]